MVGTRYFRPMTTSHPPLAAHAWLALARGYCRRVNFAWWWQTATPWLTGMAAAGGAVILYLRAKWEAFTPSTVLIWLALAMSLAAFGTWWRARRRFVRQADGLVFLDHRLHLHNALTAAAQGVGAWPQPKPDEISADLRWRKLLILGPIAFVAGSLALAFFLPLPPPGDAPNVAAIPPSAMQSTEQILQALEKAEVAKPEDLEKFNEALEALKNRGPEEWYQHASLEAADHLKESVGQAAGQLGQHFEEAASSLEKLSDLSSEATPAAKQQAADALAQALEGLQNGALQPNQKLMDALKKLDPQDLNKQLSKEQQQQLQDQLRKNAGACKNCQKPGGAGQPGSEEQAMRDAIEKGENQKPGEGDGENAQEGAGPPERGPGAADLNPKNKESNLNTNNPEKEQTQDLERLAPGDLLGTSDGEHKVDQSPQGPQTTGQSAAEGTGGEAVMKDQWLPSEKGVLRKYFK